MHTINIKIKQPTDEEISAMASSLASKIKQQLFDLLGGAPAPKKRGRPKKATQPKPAAKKRGRPRKPKAAPATNEQAAADMQAATPG